MFLSEKYMATETRPKQMKIKKLQENPKRAGAVIAICMQRDPKESLPKWEEVAAVAMAPTAADFYRARTRAPGPAFRAADFGAMGATLNAHLLRRSPKFRACAEFEVPRRFPLSITWATSAMDPDIRNRQTLGHFAPPSSSAAVERNASIFTNSVSFRLLEVD